MAKINGTDLRVYKDGALIGYEREFTFSLERDLPDASNKDSDGFAEHIQGQGSASLEFTAMVDFSATYGIQESIAELIARTDIYVSWKDTDSSTYFYAGKASYASISQDAPNEDVSSWSGSITINGDWGIYPYSITRTLRTDNNNSGFQGWQIFGADSGNSFYYMDNTTGEQIRLKNGVETTITSGYTAGDFVGYDNNLKNAYTALQTTPTFLKILNGVETGFAYSELVTTYCFCVDGDNLYYTHISAATLYVKKINWKTGAVAWNVSTGFAEADAHTFQIIKQSTHIVMSYYDDVSLTEWKLRVHSESTGAFVRTIAVVNDADTIGVWLAVLGTNLYLSYGDGTNTYLKKLTFNNTVFSTISTTATANAVVPLRSFNSKLYAKQATGGDINIYSSADALLGIVNTLISNITDFTINNGVLIAYSSGTTSIKCFPV